MTTFKLTLYDGHPIISDNGTRILVDTGSPINVHSLNQCEFLGKSYVALTSFNGNNVEQFGKLIGTPIDMVMGTGILKDYRVLFDYRNSEITFGVDEPDLQGESIIFKMFMGVPVVEVGIPGRVVQCILDSGAKLSYLTSNIIADFKSLRDVTDFYPGYGQFTTPCFDIMTKLGLEDFNIGYGRLPGQLASLLTGIGKDGVLGHDFFNNFKLLLDMKNNRLTYLKAE